MSDIDNVPEFIVREYKKGKHYYLRFNIDDSLLITRIRKLSSCRNERERRRQKLYAPVSNNLNEDVSHRAIHNFTIYGNRINDNNEQDVTWALGTGQYVKQVYYAASRYD